MALTLLNGLEQQLLTLATVLAAIPAAVLLTVAGERRIAAQQDVRDDAQRPQVAALVVVVGLADEQIDHLGGHKFGAAHLCQLCLRRTEPTDRLTHGPANINTANNCNT